MDYIRIFKQMWKYAEKERWKIVVFLLLHCISILGELGQPIAFAMILNTIQKNDSNMMNDIIKWLLIFLLCFVIFEIFHRSARFIERYVAFRNRKRFVMSMQDHIQSLPLSWHTDNHSGSTINRINKAADALYWFSQTQMIYVSVFMKFWIPLIVLWRISPLISIASLLVGILMVLVTKFIYKYTVPEYNKQNEKLHYVAAGIHDFITNIRTVIMLRLGNHIKRDIEKRIDDVFPHIKKENRLTHIKCFSTGFMMLILEIGLIFYYISSKNSAGEFILIGSITIIFQYLHQFMEPFKFYSGDYESIIHWVNDFKAVDIILKSEQTEGINTSIAPFTWRNIIIKGLDFAYKDKEETIKDISIQINHNKSIAFVGESGAGKSTLLKLLRGLNKVDKGTIKIDGNNDSSFDDLSAISTLIPQEAEIFENSIRYNITLSKTGISDKINECLYTSKFNDVVEQLTLGIDDNIREKGVNLSGGEMQRLALARGLYNINESSLVLLDEPTSGVDPATEISIFERIFKQLNNKSIVCVLHRLHLLKYFDYVYVFKDGQIVEEGTFQYLKSSNGEFTRLWNKYLAEENNEIKVKLN